MKKLTTLFMFLIIASFISGCGGKINSNIATNGLESKKIERIVISSSKYTGGRYTIIDEGSISRIKNHILKAKDASVNIKLEPDFVFDLFDATKKIATYKYIAGVDDSKTGNLIDESGKIYHASQAVEDEFMKRLMKDGGQKNIQEYYISAISLLIDKTYPKEKRSDSPGDVVIVVDIRKDYNITRYLTSIQQKRIFDSIDEKGVKIKFPTEVDKWDYNIKLNTEQYSDTSCYSTATVTDSKNSAVKYELSGTFNKKWDYFIKYK